MVSRTRSIRSARSSACTRTTIAAPASPRANSACWPGRRVSRDALRQRRATGNVDIVTLALNMFTQGVNPKLDFSKLREVRDHYEGWTKLDVPQRQPYAATWFSRLFGSHQDAIKQGLKDRVAHPDWPWEVPYLSIDPHDIGAITAHHSHQQPVGQGGVA